MDTNSPIISIYPDIKKNTSQQYLSLLQFLNDVKYGKWQDIVLQIRIIKDKEERRQHKAKCPYVTISGYFKETRSSDKITKHSGFLAIDIDDLNEEVEPIRELLKQDPYIYSIFTSISGNGLCVLFKIDSERHRDAFDGISNHLLTNYQLIVDPSCKDVSRARFISFDPDLYLNEKSAAFKKYLPKEKKKKIQEPIFVKTEFDEVVNQMVKQGVNCVEDYRDWISVGFGIAHKFGEGGRDYFHSLSSISTKYDEKNTDKQYDNLLKARGTKVSTIATIYYFAKKAGIEIYSKQTKKIASITSTQKKSGLKPFQIVSNLQKFEGIPKEQAEEIVAQAYESKSNYDSNDSIVENLRTYIKSTYNLRRNIITRKIEIDGKPLDDIDFNTMFLDAKILFEDLTFDLFMKIIFSNNTQNYNPLLEWFDYNQAQPSGIIEQFFSCFETKDNIQYFGKKWLVSIISAIHGVHSPLMLILAGEKQGTGKTEAFRRLLPKDLQHYYAESKLDAGKDDEILMTQKLIIMDDEMGGKSKKESKRLKELTSKQTFTLREPYGKMNVDLNRLAVLCGTTNDLEILNDPTGNRRLLPIQIESIDFEKYNKVDKRLLLIEAFNLYHSGYEWQLSREDIELMKGEHTKFTEYTKEYELIAKYFKVPGGNYSIEMSASEIQIYIEQRTQQKLTTKRIGMEMKKMGFQQIIKKVNSQSVRLWDVHEITETFNSGTQMFSSNAPNPF